MEYVLVAHLPDGTLQWPLPEGDSIIGRRPVGNFRIPNISVSRWHAMISRRGDSIEILDLDSKTGTWVNRQRLTQAQRIYPGDVIQLGVITLEIAEASPAADESPSPGRQHC